MNKFQKIVIQITKDDFNKSKARGTHTSFNFREERNTWRIVLKGSSLERIRDFKHYNKGLEV